MFTGIIQNQGKIVFFERVDQSIRIQVDTGFQDLELGESVCVNGVCLTVVESTRSGEASFFISHETIERSNLGSLSKDSLLNLERALTLQTRISGHLVQGHVDGQARLIDTKKNSDSYDLTFEIPNELSRYCIEKGSISLNGISLTINSIYSNLNQENCTSTFVRVTIIPHTWSHTNLSQLSIGDWVNIEVDLIAKYTERLCRNSPKL